MDARKLVLVAGTEIRATGHLVRTREGDWFGPPLLVALPGYAPGHRPPPQPSTLAVPVEGADFDHIASRYERDGNIEGLATIDGVWLEDRVRVIQQSDERPEPEYASWSEPPCLPPPGGWPHGQVDDNLDFDPGDIEDTGAAVTMVIFRPSDDQAVLVVAASDIPAVEARLRPQLLNRLCVVPSRWTRKQLDDAQRHLTDMAERWRIYQWGPSCDEQAQPAMRATLVRVTDEIAQWIDSQPRGLVIVEPWLIPRPAVET